MFRPIIVALLLCVTAAAQVREKETPELRQKQVRQLLEEFNAAFEQRDVEAISHIVSSDLTVVAGGETVQSWTAYRDNVLYKTFSKPAPTSTWEIESLTATPEMAWALTKTTVERNRDGAPEFNLYTTYVLEKRAESAEIEAASGSVDKQSAKTTVATAPSWRIVFMHSSGNRPRRALGQTAQNQTEQQ